MSISASATVRIMGEAGRPLIDNYRSLIPVSLADGRRDRRAQDLQIPIRCETTHFLKVFCGGILSDLETRKATLEKNSYDIGLEYERGRLYLFLILKFIFLFILMQIVYC